jgi:hypothetical protein
MMCSCQVLNQKRSLPLIAEALEASGREKITPVRQMKAYHHSQSRLDGSSKPENAAQQKLLTLIPVFNEFSSFYHKARTSELKVPSSLFNKT